MALTQVASGLIASVAASTLTGTQTIPRGTLPTGSVLQVVTANYYNAVSISTTSFSDTGLTGSITPLYSSSKILVMVNQPGFAIYSSGGNAIIPNLCRNGSEILRMGQSQNATTNFTFFGINALYLDSPATTSSTTYKTQVKWGTTASSSNTVYLNWTSDANGVSIMILMEIAA